MEIVRMHSPSIGVSLSEAQLEQLAKYREGVLKWNESINLTAIEDPAGFSIKHILDSLSVLKAIPEGTTTLVDVGTGAGFPGVPVKIARPEISVTLVEAVGKKASVIDHLTKEIGIEGIEIVNARAEEVGKHPDYREHFDVAVARAVAHLPVLLEYLLPLVRVGGRAIAMKVATQEELAHAENALAELGGKIIETIPISLPEVPERHLIVIEKVTQTPEKYPRAAGIPAQKPL